MPKTKEISEDIRKMVVKLRREGKSLQGIGEILNLTKPTVQTIIKNFENNGNYANKHRSGRPRKLTERLERTIIRTVKDNPKKSAVAINNEIRLNHDIEVCSQTVRRCIKRNGFLSRVARKKPLLRAVNVVKRLEYAEKYKNVHVSDPTFWERVIFTDECKFMVFGGDGRAKVWRKPNTEFLPQNVNATVKHGGGSLMVWGCMAANGVGNLRFMEGTMNKTMYIEILKDSYIPSTQKLGLAENAIFMHDNDPKHSSNLVKEWLLYNVKNKLEHPPQSPDLNAIEHLWDHLKRALKKRNITSIPSLKEALIQEWNLISAETTRKLALSMPARLSAVVDAKGSHTRY